MTVLSGSITPQMSGSIRVPIDNIPISMSEVMGHINLEDKKPKESSLSDYDNDYEYAVWEVE